MKCPKCGYELEEGKLYCSSCGSEIQYVPDYEPEIEESIDTTTNTITDTLNPKKKKKFSNVFHDFSLFTKIVIGISFVVVFMSILGTITYVRNNSFDYQYKKALKYADNEDYPNALTSLGRAIDLDQENTDLILLESNYYLLYGFRDTAKTILQNAINSNIATFEIYETLIQLYIEDENLEAIANIITNTTNNLIYEKYKKYIAIEPYFNYKEGTFYNRISLELLATDNGTIYYTLNGTTPNASSIEYMEPFYLDEGSYSISTIFINDFGISSSVVEHTYIIDLSRPYAPDVNIYSGITSVPKAIIIDVQEDCEVLYSLDGADLTEDSFHYKSPIAMPIGDFVLRCVTMNKNKEYSKETTRVMELILPGEISVEHAISIVYESLIQEERILDMDGNINDLEGTNSYTTNSGFSFEEEPYFLIYEWYTGQEGISKKTGNLFGVQMISGEFSNVAFDEEGNYRIY